MGAGDCGHTISLLLFLGSGMSPGPPLLLPGASTSCVWVCLMPWGAFCFVEDGYHDGCPGFVGVCCALEVNTKFFNTKFFTKIFTKFFNTKFFNTKFFQHKIFQHKIFSTQKF